MKTAILVSVLTLMNLSTMAQIGDVKRSDNGYTIVYDTNNNRITGGYVGNPNDDWDFSSCIIVFRGKDTKMTMVYDKDLRLLSSGYAGEAGFSLKVVGCRIVLKSNDGYKMIYDKDLHLVESGW